MRLLVKLNVCIPFWILRTSTAIFVLQLTTWVYPSSPLTHCVELYIGLFINVSKTSAAQYSDYSKKKTLKLTDTSSDGVAPQNMDKFINTAGNIFNLAMFIAFTAMSTHIVCHLPYQPAKRQQLHRTIFPEGIGVFHLTQRHLVQNSVFSLNNMPFCLVRYYTSCSFKNNPTLQLWFRLHATHSNDVIKNNSLNVRSFCFSELVFYGREIVYFKCMRLVSYIYCFIIQGGSNMTGTDLYVNKPHCAAAVRPWESEATTSTLSPARVRTSSVLSGSC